MGLINMDRVIEILNRLGVVYCVENGTVILDEDRRICEDDTFVSKCGDYVLFSIGGEDSVDVELDDFLEKWLVAYSMSIDEFKKQRAFAKTVGAFKNLSDRVSFLADQYNDFLARRNIARHYSSASERKEAFAKAFGNKQAYGSHLSLADWEKNMAFVETILATMNSAFSFPPVPHSLEDDDIPF